MAKDQDLIRRTLERNPLHSKVARLFTAAGFQVSSAAAITRQVCAIYVRPGRAVRHLFGVRREVLVWVADYPDFEARNVSDALDHVARSGGRIEDDFVVVVTGDPETSVAVEQATERLAGQFQERGRVSRALDD